ncbi:hypothetical protein SLE2022_290490 [Rubroshorea leprosula]
MATSKVCGKNLELDSSHDSDEPRFGLDGEKERKREERRKGNEEKTLGEYQWSSNDFVEVDHHLVHEWVNNDDSRS